MTNTMTGYPPGSPIRLQSTGILKCNNGYYLGNGLKAAVVKCSMVEESDSKEWMIMSSKTNETEVAKCLRGEAG